MCVNALSNFREEHYFKTHGWATINALLCDATSLNGPLLLLAIHMTGRSDSNETTNTHCMPRMLSFFRWCSFPQMHITCTHVHAATRNNQFLDLYVRNWWDYNIPSSSAGRNDRSPSSPPIFLVKLLTQALHLGAQTMGKCCDRIYLMFVSYLSSIAICPNEALEHFWKASGLARCVQEVIGSTTSCSTIFLLPIRFDCLWR